MSTHPQQRFASPSRSLSLLLHATGLASFLASFKHLSQYDMPIANAYGGYSQFLTILSLAVSTVTFAVAVVADLTLNSTLFSIKNKLAVVTAPVEVLVALMYWGIFAYDPQLLFPDEFRMPIIADIGFHAMPGIVLSLDVLFFSPPWTISASSMLALSNVLAFLYWAWVEQCYTHNGWYPYPMFHLLNTFQRSLLFAFGASLMTGSTITLKWIHNKMNIILKQRGEVGTKSAKAE